MEGLRGVMLTRWCRFKAGIPPWEPPAEGKGTAGWPGPPEEQGCCPHLPPRSSAQSGRRPSGKSLGCRGSGGTRSCQGLGNKKKCLICTDGMDGYLLKAKVKKQKAVQF